ncbi:hypothetical protein K2Z83_28545, partial [Oscillochloris sp. ZM17-4]|uniref:hypothetical protein n=1 Tax=Oscillochloris sp. ZM17-4 TaxID=2866714 RepID=UPI001C730F2F
MAPVITSDQYAAAQSEMVISWWRDWTRFLTARGTLNTIQLQRMSGTMTTVADAFDQTQAKGSAEAQERQATATLDRLPAARRTVFEAELNDRVALLQQAAGTAASEDLTAFIRQALHEFTEQAYGRVTTGKHAYKAAVPCEARAWFSFEPKYIDSLPPEAAWSIARPEQGPPPQWQLIAAIAGIIVIIAGMVAYYLWPQLSPAQVVIAAAPATILVNEAPITPWPVRAVVIGETALPVARLDAEAWPAAPSDVAGWRTSAVWPAELCLPATAADPLPTAITLLSAG